MSNITLLSLTISSFFSISPFYTINNNLNQKLSIIENSYFTRFVPNVIFSNNNHHSTIINNNNFILTLSTPLVFTDDENPTIFSCVSGTKCCMSDKYAYTKNENIENQNVTANDFNVANWENHHPFFESEDCGNLRITKCNFIGCMTTENYGGGIKIDAYLTVILHNSIFDSCKTKYHGAGGAIGKGFKITANDPDFGYAEKLDIQYTCFSNCYQEVNDQGFGSALIMSAENVIFFYASTVNCPSQNKAYGAQFDIQASNSITSQYVNASGGNSKFCGAMEYRKATSGFFQFQTLTQMRCKYVTSFTSVSIAEIDITSCNVNNNTISGNEVNDGNFPCLIFVREKNLHVNNFYFFDNIFNDNGRLTEKDHNKQNPLTIKLSNCYADFENPIYDASFVTIENCVFMHPIQKTFPLRQLQLGHCQGDIPPGPMIISSFFTASSPFTASGIFSKSGTFSKSNSFTPSKKFSSSSSFSESDTYTASNKFTNSKKFTPSVKFSKSSSFSKSDVFTESNKFTNSKKFTPSVKFSKSSPFTLTGYFTISQRFTMSSDFTTSSPFTQSDRFDQTHKFTASNTFTKSNSFTQSNHFTSSNHFSKSDYFSSSHSFTVSHSFTKSRTFTKSDYFTKSNYFTASSHFTKSQTFTASDHFTESDHFTKSSCFTPSDHFTQSSCFSMSDAFSKSVGFSASDELYVPRDLNVGKGSKTNKTAVIGAAAGAIAAVIALALIVFFIVKKRKKIATSSAGLIDETLNSVTVDNTLNSVMNEDDPFANDFKYDL